MGNLPRALGLSVALLFAGFSQVAAAQQVSGSAFGESIDLSINSIFSLVTVEAQSGPLPNVDGIAPPDFNASDSLLGVEVNANIKLLGGLLPPSTVGILDTGVLNVATTGSAGTGVDSSASVDDVSLELLGSALLPLVVGIDADVVASTATASGSCAAPLAVSGTTDLVNADLASALGELAGIVGGLEVNPAPNTVLLDLALLGGHLRIVLNEQIVTGDGVSSLGITVNAIHITLEDIPVAALITDINGEVIISQSKASVSCAVADLSLTKSDSVDPVVVGSPLTYTLTVGNSGPDAAPGVLVEDVLPAGVTFNTAIPSQGSCNESGGTVQCDLGSVASGSNATVQINVTPTAVGNLSNTATVSSDAADATPGNNSATETTSVNPLAGSADLSLGMSESADPVTAGDPLTISLAINNGGADAAVGTELVYTLPANITLDSVTPSQGSCAVNASQVVCDMGNIANGANAGVDVVMYPLVPGQLTHVGSVSSNVPDPVPGNNSATETTTVDAVAGLSANMSIDITDAPDPVVVGQQLTYTLLVANGGTDGAGSVLVTDTLPGSVTFDSASASQGSCAHAAGVVTCSLGALANGANATVTVQVTPETAGVINNSASVSADVADPDTGDNTDSETSTVEAGDADLEITQTASPDPVAMNTTLTYTLTVTNNGPDDATEVEVVNTLPAGVTFTSAVPTQGTCSEASGIVTCDLGTLASTDVAEVVIRVVPPAVASLLNVAEVDSQLDDPDTSNNIAEETTDVVTALPAVVVIPTLPNLGLAALIALLMGTVAVVGVRRSVRATGL